MAPPALRSSSSILVGRGREREILDHLLAQVQTGHSQFVLISGEAGIGKTTVVQDVGRRASQQGTAVFVGACYDLETTPPYGPWLNAGILESSSLAARTTATPALTADRRRFLEYLMEHGPSRPSDVAAALGLNPNAVTQSLRRCLDDGLVFQPSYGVYSADPIAVAPGYSNSENEATSLVRSLYDGQNRVADGSQRALFGQIRDLLIERCRTQPTVLVLEDLHWSDQASVDLLRFIVRTLDSLPMLLIGTYRDVELAPGQPLYRLLPQLVREGNAVRLALSRFSEEEIQALVNARYGLPANDNARLVRYLVEKTEGNPFYVDELLLTLEDEKRISHIDARWVLEELTAGTIPLLVRQLIDNRLERMTAGSLDLLRLAAVIGAEIPLDLWQQVSSATDEGLLQAIDEATSLQVLETSGPSTSVRFRHALVREALYSELTLLARRTLHRNIAEALMTQPDPNPAVVAHHLVEAQEADRAIDWLIRAAHTAAHSFAFQVTIQRCEQALKFLERDEQRIADRASVLCHLAEAYRYTDIPRAIDYVESAFALVNRLDDPAIETIVRWTHAHLRSFNGERALEELDDALTQFQKLSAADRARIEHSPIGIKTGLGVHGQRLAHHGLYQRALELIHQYLDEHPPRLEPGYHTELAATLYGLGMAYSSLGEPLKALEVLGQARTHAARVGNDHLTAAILSWEHDHVYHVYFPENRTERLKLLDETDHAWRQSVYSRLSTSQRGLRLYLALFLEGRWNEVRASAAEMLGSGSMRMKCLAVMAELDRVQGHPDRARTHISQALPEGPDSEPGTMYFRETLHLQRVAAELALDEGDVTAAERWIAALERWMKWSGIVVATAEPELLRSRLRELAGDLDGARDHARHAFDLAQQPYQPLSMLVAHRRMGHLDRIARRFDRAADHVETALRLAILCHVPYEIALSQVEKARLLIAEQRFEDAREILPEILRTGQDLGARPLMDTVDELTTQLASRVSVRDVPGGLSPREMDVLRLVATGMTDAEIGERLSITPRTVGGHLQSIFNKLGISSRTAATAFAYTQRLVSRVPQR